MSLLLAPVSTGGGGLCYELTDAEKTWFGYEEKSRKCAAIQNGWGPVLSWVLLVAVGAFIAIRGIFCRRTKKDCGLRHDIAT